MKKSRIFLVLLVCLIGQWGMNAQKVGSSPEYIKALTKEWEGERFKDGRPRVSDALLERLKKIRIEEAWGYLRGSAMITATAAARVIAKIRMVTISAVMLRSPTDRAVRQFGLLENAYCQPRTGSGRRRQTSGKRKALARRCRPP